MIKAQILLASIFLFVVVFLIGHTEFGWLSGDKEIVDDDKVKLSHQWVRFCMVVEFIMISLNITLLVVSVFVVIKIVKTINSDESLASLKKSVYAFMTIFITQFILRISL